MVYATLLCSNPQCGDSREHGAAVHALRMKGYQMKGSETPSYSKGMQEQILDTGWYHIFAVSCYFVLIDLKIQTYLLCSRLEDCYQSEPDLGLGGNGYA